MQKILHIYAATVQAGQCIHTRVQCFSFKSIYCGVIFKANKICSKGRKFLRMKSEEEREKERRGKMLFKYVSFYVEHYVESNGKNDIWKFNE